MPCTEASLVGQYDRNESVPRWVRQCRCHPTSDGDCIIRRSDFWNSIVHWREIANWLHPRDGVCSTNSTGEPQPVQGVRRCGPMDGRGDDAGRCAERDDCQLYVCRRSARTPCLELSFGLLSPVVRCCYIKDAIIPNRLPRA